MRIRSLSASLPLGFGKTPTIRSSLMYQGRGSCMAATCHDVCVIELPVTKADIHDQDNEEDDKCVDISG